MTRQHSQCEHNENNNQKPNHLSPRTQHTLWRCSVTTRRFGRSAFPQHVDAVPRICRRQQRWCRRRSRGTNVIRQRRITRIEWGNYPGWQKAGTCNCCQVRVMAAWNVTAGDNWTVSVMQLFWNVLVKVVVAVVVEVQNRLIDDSTGSAPGRRTKADATGATSMAVSTVTPGWVRTWKTVIRCKGVVCFKNASQLNCPWSAVK